MTARTRRLRLWALAVALLLVAVAVVVAAPPSITDARNADHARQVWEHAGIPHGVTPRPTWQQP